MEKRCQFYFDVLEIFSDHASVQPQETSDQMKTSKAMHTSPRRAACRIHYLDLDSSGEDKDNEDDEHDQNREEVVEALASGRSVIGDPERDTSMNKDEDDQDKTIDEQKQEDSSVIQTTTMTQVNFPLQQVKWLV